MSWYPIKRQSAFQNQTIIGCGLQFIPHLIFSTEPNGDLKAHGLVGSIFANITWAMGMNLKVQVNRDGTYGMMDLDGNFYGGYRDLVDEVCDVLIQPNVRTHPIDDIFPKAYALKSVNVRITSGMKDRFQKANSFFSEEGLFTEVYPMLTLFLIVCITLSTLFSAVYDREHLRKYFHIYFWAYMQSFFLEASHVLNSSVAEQLTFPSKMVFGAWIAGMFLTSTYMQTALKSSYMVEVETDRIRSMKDIIDRPDLLPMMHSDTPFILSNLKAPYHKEVIAQYERLKPETDVPFTRFFVQETLTKMVTRRGILFTDEFGFKFMLPRLCPLVKDHYFYTAPEVPCLAHMTWYYRLKINQTLIKEIDKRLRWLEQGDVPWIPRFSIDPANSPCYVMPKTGASISSGEGQTMQIDDYIFFFLMLVGGSVIALIVFVTEMLAYLWQRRRLAAA